MTTIAWHTRWIGFAKNLWREIEGNDILDGAAVLAFYFVLAVFPAVIFVLSLLPAFHIPHLQEAILDLLHQILPEQSANLFQVTIRYVTSRGSKGMLTFGLIFALWSGSAGAYAIMERLNVISNIKERRPFWKVRGIAILLMLFFTLLMIVSLSLAIFGGAVQSWVASIIGWSRPLRFFFAAYRWIVLAIALLFGLAVVYRFGPDGNAKFRFLSPGSTVAAILIALFSVGFRFYVSTFGNYNATYGNLAAIIVLMLWMYLAGIALLVGWEINKILHAHGIEPIRVN